LTLKSPSAELSFQVRGRGGILLIPSFKTTIKVAVYEVCNAISHDLEMVSDKKKDRRNAGDGAFRW
jgi:hypothetical protein